jgi:hypothetical protein
MSQPTSLPVPTFSSPLADALSRFLAFKRAAGCRYDEEARALRALDRFLTTTLNPDDPVITLDVVRGYVAPTQPDPTSLPLPRSRAAADRRAGGPILGHSPP